MKRQLILTVIFAIATTLTNAQTNELPANVGKGRIHTSDGQKIVFTNLVTGSESHNYKTASGNKTQTIPAGNVLRIEQQTGTEAGKWALWLGLAGLVGSTLGALQAITEVETLGGETDKSKVAPIIIGFTAGSALIGAAIGAGKKKYKTVYTNPKYDTSSVTPPMRVGLTCSPQQGLGLGLNYRF